MVVGDLRGSLLLDFLRGLVRVYLGCFFLSLTVVLVVLLLVVVCLFLTGLCFLGKLLGGDEFGRFGGSG